MFNPFRSEADAFRLLLGAAVYLGAIGIAALAGGFWLGLIVFIVLTLAIIVWWALAYAAPDVHPRSRVRMPTASAGSSSSRTRRSGARRCSA